MKSVTEWLDATATRFPEKVAVSGIDGELTFSELQARALATGFWLAQNLEPRKPVAIFAEKSPECLAAMLGAAYARCPYSVVDVRQPIERVAHIAATLAPGAVLASAAELERARVIFASAGTGESARADEGADAGEAAGLGKSEAGDLGGGVDIPVVVFDEAMAKIDDAAQVDFDARRVLALDVDPLYINFTSGSTGTPKGVAVAHRSVIDFIPQFAGIFGIGEGDRIGNQAPFDFDVSVKDIYSGLFTGATIHLIPRDYFSQPTLLMDFLADRAITTCTWAVSAMCFVSIMGGFDYRVPETIEKVIFSGEVMPPKQLARWRQALPHAMFANVYGPTEVTCNCTYHVVDREYGKNEVIPAGKPFPNEGVFLLDENDVLVDAPGSEGEVCVTGTCLALGYYNAPARTAESFVSNPLNSAFPETMYRTGDLAFWDDEGRLVYSGRKDHQIKHMGQRIELGEIEAAAQAFDYIERACCVYDAKRKKIHLFIDAHVADDVDGAEGLSAESSDSVQGRKLSALPRDGAQPSETVFSERLLADLAAKLPHYMVPGKVHLLSALPVTKNGKIDRRALEEIATRRQAKGTRE